MRRGRRRAPPLNLAGLTPPYVEGYLDSRYTEYRCYDQLPPRWRKILRNTMREYQARDVLTYLNAGYSDEYILSSIKDAERSSYRRRARDYHL